MFPPPRCYNSVSTMPGETLSKAREKLDRQHRWLDHNKTTCFDDHDEYDMKEKEEKEEKEEQKVKDEQEEAKRRASLAQELAEATRAQKVQEEQVRAENLKRLADRRKLDAVEEAAKEKRAADEILIKEQERAKRKKQEAKKAHRKLRAAKLSAREALVKEREAKIHAGLEVEEAEIFQANLDSMEAKDQKEKEDHARRKEAKNRKKQTKPEMNNVADQKEDTNTNSNDLLSTPSRIQSTRPIPAFLSPRGNPACQKPNLPEYGKEFEMLQDEVDFHEIEAGLTLREIAKQMEQKREIEIEASNLKLQYVIRNCPPHYDHLKFEESYKNLIQQQIDFKKTLLWDKDPEKRSMPVSPRITSYYNPRVKDSRKIPQKPTDFGDTRNTPNSAHRKITRGAAYKATRKKKKKRLSAKAMLDAFVKSRAAIPPQQITNLTPVRNNNNVKIVLEPRSTKKKKRALNQGGKRDAARSPAAT